jgi:bacteriochlorophyllide a dehydrogenase
MAKGGEIVLAGFYTEPLSFAFPPAFMREARFRDRRRMGARRHGRHPPLVESGTLSLADLITHTRPAADAAERLYDGLRRRGLSQDDTRLEGHVA